MTDALSLIGEDDSLQPMDVVELYCNGEPVSNELDLATIKYYMWKRASDLEIKYQRRAPR